MPVFAASGCRNILLGKIGHGANKIRIRLFERSPV
jgi:hypothetical protein